MTRLWNLLNRPVASLFDRLGIPRYAHPETVARVFLGLYLAGVAALILADAPLWAYVVYAVAGFAVSLVLG